VGGQSVAATLEATQLKVVGNAAMQRGDCIQAIDAYTEALNINGSHISHTILSNRSAAHLLKGDGLSALEDADSVIALKPAWHKGYVRQAEALTALDQKQKALEAWTRALELEDSLMESPEFLQKFRELKRRVDGSKSGEQIPGSGDSDGAESSVRKQKI